MKYDIEDAKIFIETHKNYVVTSYSHDTIPLIGYTPERLLQIVQEYIEDIKKDFDKDYLINHSFSELIFTLWSGNGDCELIHIINYMHIQHVKEIILEMVKARLSCEEIKEVLFILLRFKKDNMSLDIIDEVLRIYNENQKDVDNKVNII